MDWKQLRAYITGSVDQALLLRNEYLVMENRILHQQITGHIHLNDSERKALADIAHRLGKQALQEVATLVKPDTLLAWHRKLVAVAGVTPHPDQRWMTQIARNVTMADWGFLQPGQYLIHDSDGKFCPAFQRIRDEAGVQRVPLPPRSPNLNAYAERWVRSVKEEALSRLILFGERSLQHVLKEYVTHFHHERPHQGKGNVVLMPVLRHEPAREGVLQCRERLGGLLTYYYRDAA